MIRPEDIPQSLMDATFRHTESYTEAGQRRDIAAILNAAIEAGVVSPPVWAIRNIKTGEIIYERQNPKLTIDGTPTDSDVWEKVHWKGEEP